MLGARGFYRAVHKGVDSVAGEDTEEFYEEFSRASKIELRGLRLRLLGFWTFGFGA